jgi:hypothetical protein
MATALIGPASFAVDESTGAPQYVGEVHFAVGTVNYNLSTIVVALGAGDTLASLQTKFLAAIDAEADRLGLAAPTAVYGGAVTKLR